MFGMTSQASFYLPETAAAASARTGRAMKARTQLKNISTALIFPFIRLPVRVYGCSCTGRISGLGLHSPCPDVIKTDMVSATPYSPDVHEQQACGSQST